MPVFVSPEECGDFRKALAGIMKENEEKAFISLMAGSRLMEVHHFVQYSGVEKARNASIGAGRISRH
jgi:hypothetical protein